MWYCDHIASDKDEEEEEKDDVLNPVSSIQDLNSSYHTLKFCT